MRNTDNRSLAMRNVWPALAAAAAVVWGGSTAAVPAVDPVTRLQRMPAYQVEYALAVGKAMRAAKAAGDHEAAALYDKALGTPIAPQDIPRHKAWADANRVARQAGDVEAMRNIERQRLDYAATTARDAPSIAAEPRQQAPSPTPWREYTRMAELRDRMNAEQAIRQRVKVRTAEVAIGNELPLLYPAFHWLPYTMLKPALAQWTGQSSAEGIRDYLREDILVVLFSLLNVKIHKPDVAGVQCCAPVATLTVELALPEAAPELVRIPLAQEEPGVYRIADPFRASNQVRDHIATMNGRPFFSIVSVEGVGYRGTPRHPTIAYMVRWDGLVLEYGSHSWLDPEPVIR